jgi:pimeloyl-ACP methyl ester carboxylesterase
MSDPDPVPANYSPPTYARDVIQLLDQLRIAEAVFVGTSLGGLVTMLVAAAQPQRIAATVLNDVGPELDQRGIDRIRTYVGKPMRFGDWDEAAEYVSGINGSMPTSHQHADWIEAARRLCKEDGEGIVFDYDMAIAEPFNQPGNAVPVDMWPLFHQLGKRPLLIVRGQNSDLLSAETAAAMLEAAPGAQLITVPGVGHAPELTEPAATAGIDAFLAHLGPSN